MKIFDKRPLSLILCILLGAFVFFTLGDTVARIILATSVAVLIILSVFIKNLQKEQKLSLIFFSSIIIIASLLSYVYFNLWFYANDRFDERCEIEGTVLSFEFEDSCNTVDLKADSINDSILSGYKLKVILDEKDVNNITVGTKIKFNANLIPLNESNQESAGYYSEGFNAKATDVEDLSVIGYDEPGAIHRISEYRKSLARRIVLYSNSESGGILAALLLGERSFLSNKINLDFSRIGISHVLALSGMHLVIICYLVSKILVFFGINKSSRKIFEIVLTLFYMTLTGFSVSVMRAGLMLILSALLFLLCGSKDSITNLFISVSFILLIQPYSVYDLSLWLSAFATLGIIIFAQISDEIQQNKNGKKSLIRFFTPFLSSTFAIVATVFISSVSFDSISSLSVLTTAIFSPLIFVFMHIGLLYLFTASFLPLGKVIIFIGGIITDLAAFFSSFKYALLTADFSITKVLIISVSILFLVFMVVEIRRKRLAMTLIAILFVATVFFSMISTSYQISTFKFQYLPHYGDERIYISENSEICLIDAESPSTKQTIKTEKYLKQNGTLYLDSYFITSYNDETADTLEYLFSKIYVDTLYLPLPKSEDQTTCFEKIYKLRDEYKTDFIVYEENDIINFESFSIVMAYYDTYGKFAMTINYEDEFYTYMSADMLDSDTAERALSVIYGANTAIIGATGKKSSSEFIYKIPGETKIIYNKKSGPTDQILDFYEDRITVDPNMVIDLYVE